MLPSQQISSIISLTQIRGLVAAIFYFFFSVDLVAKPNSAPCNCTENLDSITHHIESNYPFFLFKKTNDNAYLLHKNQLRTESFSIKDAKKCHKLLQLFLEWFRDGHLGVSYSGDVFKPKKIKNQNTSFWANLTEENAKKYCDSIGNKDPMVGIWESYESFYKALIAKSKDEKGYEAYLISTINRNWKPGEVKMEFKPDPKGKLKCTFYTSDHSAELPRFILNNNILEINKTTVWNRIYPKTENKKSVESYVSARYKWTQEFRPWNKEVFYIQLQNINAGVKPLIDSLIKKNTRAIQESDKLIIDLRDNEGGDLTVFDLLLPFIITKNAIQYGTKYFCTTANLKNYQTQMAELEGEIDPEYEAFVYEMNKNEGKIWKVENDTIQPDLNFKKPKQVILLMNEKCKSSTEDFILTVQSGSEAIVAGQKTGGVADFEEVVDVALPCPDLILFHPIGLSNRLPESPLDGKGIEPDILLKSKSKAWQPWIREVLIALTNKKP